MARSDLQLDLEVSNIFPGQEKTIPIECAQVPQLAGSSTSTSKGF
jgi:hypothetical protein